MAIFDYRGKSSIQLLKDVQIIESVNYGAATNANYTFIGKDGWKVLDGATLAYNGCANPYEAFYGESTKFSGAECNVLGKYDAQGKLVSIGLSFWGTGTYRGAPDTFENSARDAVSDISAAVVEGYADNYVLNAYENLMSSVAAFASANGLSGNDVIVTGYSLGGLAVNSLATLSSRGEWNGFFQDSSYIALASPTQNQANDNVLNIGYENDPVFRVLNGSDFDRSSLFKHDAPLETCTNNMVSFNEFYAGVTYAPGFFSIANSYAWATHVNGFDGLGFMRIVNSEVYDYTHLNSNVIVSTLSEVSRGKLWVSDLNRSITHKGSTFIIGTETNDFLKGGKGNDYLCGGEGNDTFRDHSGFNVIYGGSGTNSYLTDCRVTDFTFSQDADGILYFKYSTGNITRAENIQYVNADYKVSGFLGIKYTVNSTWAVTDYGLNNGVKALSFANSLYATEENDYTLSAVGHKSWLYSGDQDSQISVVGNNNTVVSGNGDDVIHLNGSNNTLLFYGDFGQDSIYNLSASDSLIFMANQNIADNDSYLNHLSFEAGNALLTYGDSSVTLVGVSADMLSGMNITVA